MKKSINTENTMTQKKKKYVSPKLKFTTLKTIFSTILLLGCLSLPVFADGDPITVINNLNNFIFQIIHAVGLILTGFGIVQIGLSLKSHDPSQRANGIMTVAGGVIIMFAKTILQTITG